MERQSHVGAVAPVRRAGALARVAAGGGSVDGGRLERGAAGRPRQGVAARHRRPHPLVALAPLHARNRLEGGGVPDGGQRPTGAGRRRRRRPIGVVDVDVATAGARSFGPRPRLGLPLDAAAARPPRRLLRLVAATGAQFAQPRVVALAPLVNRSTAFPKWDSLIFNGAESN